MSIKSILTQCKVSRDDKRKINALIKSGQSEQDAIRSVLTEAHDELDDLRTELKASGFSGIDVHKIENRKG